ncbi:hypothetical protein LNQ81_02815 [Myroides sp. M-43]|uniref:hypothetical protein n=1 Tax=Myroides oncorhynchi TaxID=2893756 RepID=UPI001E590CC2|nr:hypothetical protein [Myroides oncorhynchi]MCC9041634.1 hypothetical protein [Myroides oncorhynchi]
MKKSSAYFIINISFAILLSVMFLYLYFIDSLDTNELRIKSSCEGLPEYLCKSRGLTRDFITILHNGCNNTNLINPYSIKIFSFFLYSWTSRILISLLPYRWTSKVFITIDIILISIFFLVAFLPLVIL